MQFLLALDQGTTSSRAIVFDVQGSVRAVAQREFQQFFPAPGWVEHDAQEIWRTQLDVAREAIAKAGLQARDIAAIGITNQRETTVLWDRKTSVPIAPAIVWQDRRTTAHCETLRASGFEATVRAKTGLLLDPYFSATKLAWLIDQVPGARERAQAGELAFGTIDTWLIWNLTGGRAHVSDPSNAARTMLFDIDADDWDDTLLAQFGIPRAVLPRIVRSSGVVAETDPALFGAPVPIAGIAGDQQSALFGQACLQPGMAKNTYGTGCFMLLNTGSRRVDSRAGLLTTRAADGHERHFALEGAVFIGGAVVQWLRDGLGFISASYEIEALAQSVADAGGVQFVPAFAGLGAPYWDPRARGTMVGLTRGTTRAHLARAALEAIALQSADVLEAMQTDAGIALAELRVDGGAAANDLLMQLQADLLGVPVVRPHVLETTALGAAYLAGLGAGVWPSPTVIADNWRGAARFEPRISVDERASRLAQWRRAVERARDWHQD